MLKSSAMLLLIPLACPIIGFAQQAPPQTVSTPAWEQSQATDAARTIAYTRFTLRGTFSVPPHDQGSNRPALIIDCIPSEGPHPSKDKVMAAKLLVGVPLKIVYVEPEEIHGMSYLQRIDVRLRKDDAREEDEKWPPGPEKTSVSIPKDALKKILRAHTAAITVDDDRGSSVAMQFELNGPPPRQSCNLE